MSAEKYLELGVSATKEDVHKAIANQSKGLFPGAFCKIVCDYLGDPDYCLSMHSDGAGTKSTIAYIQYKETGNSNVFYGIAQDSIVMNTDDLLCVGATDDFFVSNTIGRNIHRIDGIAIKKLIEGYSTFASTMEKHGIQLHLTGGETADIGDLVATVIADSTIFVRMKKDHVVDNTKIKAGHVIVGLSSTGKAIYEDTENSGIASNGCTAAKHTLLSQYYADKYPETYSTTLPKNLAYMGKYKMDDSLPGSTQNIGAALLSPTRTYLPIMKRILESHFDSISGIVHCTGGGQVKCKNFGQGLHYVKDNLFELPPIFKAIREAGTITAKEMYQIFNMGHRMEIYCDAGVADEIIAISKSLNVDAKTIGKIEKSKTDVNEVTIIDSLGNRFDY